MAILITGASGFIGSKLVERLAQEGLEIIAVSRSVAPTSLINKGKIKWIRRDLARDELDLGGLKKIDAVVHLAGAKESGSGSVTPFFSGNEQSTVNLLQAVSEKTDLFIYASSQMVYGNTKHTAVTEDFPLRPYDSPYGCSKINSENWMRFFQTRSGGRYLSLRFCGFIDGGGFVDYLINNALIKENIELSGKGKVRRDYLSSADGIEALVAAINFSGSTGFMPINIGSGQALSTLQLAELVCEELNSSSLIKLRETPPPKEDFVFCIDRAIELLNFQPSILKDSVRQYARDRQGLSKVFK